MIGLLAALLRFCRTETNEEKTETGFHLSEGANVFVTWLNKRGRGLVSRRFRAAVRLHRGTSRAPKRALGRCRWEEFGCCFFFWLKLTLEAWRKTSTRWSIREKLNDQIELKRCPRWAVSLRRRSATCWMSTGSNTGPWSVSGSDLRPFLNQRSRWITSHRPPRCPCEVHSCCTDWLSVFCTQTPPEVCMRRSWKKPCPKGRKRNNHLTKRTTERRVSVFVPLSDIHIMNRSKH